MIDIVELHPVLQSQPESLIRKEQLAELEREQLALGYQFLKTTIRISENRIKELYKELGRINE